MRKRTISLFAMGFSMVLAARAQAAEMFLVAAGNNLGLPSEPALQHAERDAADVASIFNRLGEVSAPNTAVLLGESPSALSAAAAVFERRLRELSDAGAGETVLVFYFSGHADARGLHFGNALLGYDELRRLVVDSKATFRVLIVDACRSGGVTLVKGAQQIEPFALELGPPESAKGLAIITSSAAGEDSYESERLGASFFSHHLKAALRGAADANRDGRITLSEAYQYTYSQTLRSSGATARLQHPTYQFDFRGKGDLTMTRLDRDRNRSGRLTVAEPGQYLVIESGEEGKVAAELSVAKGGTTLILPTGRYFVQKRAPESYQEYQVKLEPGRQVSLSSLPFRSIRYARLLRKGGGDRALVPGIFLQGGLRQGFLDGERMGPRFGVGLALDFSWLSIGLGATYALEQSQTADKLTDIKHEELAGFLQGLRYFDLNWLSLAAGLRVEVTHHRQRFETDGEAPGRSAWSFGFGPVVALERELAFGLALSIQGGATTLLYPAAKIRAGAVTGDELDWAVSWWGHAGVIWRF